MAGLEVETVLIWVRAVLTCGLMHDHRSIVMQRREKEGLRR